MQQIILNCPYSIYREESGIMPKIIYKIVIELFIGELNNAPKILFRKVDTCWNKYELIYKLINYNTIYQATGLYFTIKIEMV